MYNPELTLPMYRHMGSRAFFRLQTQVYWPVAGAARVMRWNAIVGAGVRSYKTCKFDHPVADIAYKTPYICETTNKKAGPECAKPKHTTFPYRHTVCADRLQYPSDSFAPNRPGSPTDLVDTFYGG